MSGTAPVPRKGMPEAKLVEAEFKRRFPSQYADPAFQRLQPDLDRIAQVAWEAYDQRRKSPLTRQAGPDFADPSSTAASAIGSPMRPATRRSTRTRRFRRR